MFKTLQCEEKRFLDDHHQSLSMEHKRFGRKIPFATKIKSLVGSKMLENSRPPRSGEFVSGPSIALNIQRGGGRSYTDWEPD